MFKRVDHFVIRVMDPEDYSEVKQIIDRAWRVNLRLPPEEIPQFLEHNAGWVAFNKAQRLLGFAIIDTNLPFYVLLNAFGLQNNCNLNIFLDELLPIIEHKAHSLNRGGIAHIGYAPWLTDELKKKDFTVKDTVITYEWSGTEIPEPPPLPLGFVLRPAKYTDLQALETLDAAAFDAVWHKPLIHLEEGLMRALFFCVLEFKQRIVGYAWMDKYQDQAHLTRLAVHPEFQGQSLGRFMLSRVLTEALAARVTMLTLNTQRANARSRRLYRRYGFFELNEIIEVLWKSTGGNQQDEA